MKWGYFAKSAKMGFENAGDQRVFLEILLKKVDWVTFKKLVKKSVQKNPMISRVLVPKSRSELGQDLKFSRCVLSECICTH